MVGKVVHDFDPSRVRKAPLDLEPLEPGTAIVKQVLHSGGIIAWGWARICGMGAHLDQGSGFLNRVDGLKFGGTTVITSRLPEEGDTGPRRVACD